MAGSLVIVHLVGIVVRMSPDGIMPILAGTASTARCVDVAPGARPLLA
jgi:hypothetical protein